MIKTLANEFGLNKKVHELGNQIIGGYVDGGIIRPFAKDKIGLARVPKEDLEKLYFTSPILRNSIRNKIQMIGSAGYTIRYNSKKEKEKFEEFFKQMGQIGDDIDFDQIYNNIPRHQFVFGASPNELIWDEKDEEIVDLQRLDPKKVDYARDVNGKIILDVKTQRPIGYLLKIEKDNRIKIPLTFGDKPPEEYEKIINKNDNEIFLLPKRVAYIRFEDEGDGLESWGLLETIYHDSIRKGKLEEAGFNSAFQRWMSPLAGYVGDPTHPPTPQLATQTLESMRKMKHDLLSVFPYYVKLDTIQGNDMQSYVEMLKSLRENEASGLQMPMPFAISSGETTNRATLNNQQAMLEFGLNELVKLNAKLITKRIFRPIAESKGLETWPELMPNRVRVDELDDRAIRFSKYVERGIFTPAEVRPLLAEVEGIELKGLPSNSEDTKNTPSEEEDKDSNETEDENLYDTEYGEEPEWKQKQV